MTRPRIYLRSHETPSGNRGHEMARLSLGWTAHARKPRPRAASPAGGILERLGAYLTRACAGVGGRAGW